MTLWRDPIDVAILGGGPAGALLARLLAGRGYAVRLHVLPPGRRQGPGWIEGLAPRAIERLRGSGALTTLPAIGPLTREAHWGGLSNRHNREALVDRTTFDAALVAEARAAGVTVVEGRVSAGVTARDVNARLLIEARGRQAPRRAVALRGPRTVALVRHYGYPGQNSVAETILAAAPFGWVWAAFPGDGTVSVQIVMDADSTSLNRTRAAALFDAALARCPEVASRLGGFQPLGPVHGRDAGALLAAELGSADHLRIGDAAHAIDPLAGHGLYEAIAGAKAAEAVAATLLDRPADRARALRFHHDRCTDVFLRHARIGRDFHRMEQRWRDAPFWAARRPWPDDAPVHAAPQSAPPRVVTMPVNMRGYIEDHPVIVTADHPRGIYSIAGVPLVSLLAEPETMTADSLARRYDVTPGDVDSARGWLRLRGLSAAPVP